MNQRLHSQQRQLRALCFGQLHTRAFVVASASILAAALAAITAVLLVRGATSDPHVGAHLDLLSHYLPGYSVTWTGVLVGSAWGAGTGLALGLLFALPWNLGRTLYLRNNSNCSQSFESASRISGLICSGIVGTISALAIITATLWLLWQGRNQGLSPAEIGGHLGLLAYLLPGYSITPLGALAGAFWAMLIGGFAGQIIYRAYTHRLRIELAGSTSIDKLLSRATSPDGMKQPGYVQLDVLPIGLALGSIAAIQIFAATCVLVLRGTAAGSEHALLLSNYLAGYDVSVTGAVLAAPQVVVYALIGSLLFCSVYNAIVSRSSRNPEFPLDVSSAQLRNKVHVPRTDQEKSLKHVVVLGAGPAGLATAHELSAQGVAVTVLERNDYVGGLCRTVREDGYCFDLGGHRWFTKNEALNRWFRRLMGDEVVMVERISRIYYGGKYFQYPVEIMDVVKNAGPLTIVRAGFAFVGATLYHLVWNPHVTNMKQAYSAQFGSVLYGMFFRRYTEKVWGKPCDQLSSDWVSQRSKGLSVWTVLSEALSRKKSNVTSLIEEFMYPRDGYARIPERMAEDVEKAGNKVLLNTEVRHIHYKGANNIEVTVATSRGTQKLQATDVVSTIPLGLMARISTPPADAETLAAADSLEFRDLITVNLKLRKKQVSSDTWLYVQDEDILFGRLHEPKNWSAAMIPDPDHTSLVLECFCSRGDDIWSLSNDAIGERCVADLADKLNFIDRDEVEGWNIVRTTNSYPVYDMSYAGKVEEIKSFLEKMQGVHIVGRGGTFRYNNADHSIEMGLLLGQKILGYEVDPLDVNTEPEYQEIVDGKHAGSNYKTLVTQAQIA